MAVAFAVAKFTVMVCVLGLESVTEKLNGVLPLFPSFCETRLMAMVGCVSLSTMVMVCVAGVPTIGLQVGEVSVTVNVSFPSKTLSSVIGMLNDLFAPSPASQVRVALVAV